MDTERLRMRLNIMKMKDFKTEIVMKSKRLGTFIAKVKDIKYHDDGLQVIFSSCKETEFPKKSENDEYVTFIKNIKLVDRYYEEE